MSTLHLQLPAGYAPEEVLGSSAGVRVLRARRDGERVVLRVDERRDGFESLAELAVLSAVDHPGVARLVDHGPLPGGGRFVARRWVEGQDLLAWSRSRSGEEVGAQVARVCPALEHLHRAGFVHADLKPENVIVTPEDRPVLCDFGLSRRRGTAEPAEGASGTLFAIAPELLLGLELTTASDLFSLGAMLHRLLTGIRRSAREFYAVFPERSYLDAAGSAPEDLPAWSRDLIVSLTARDPNRRPRSAAAVGRALAERLRVPVDPRELSDELRWPPALGRDAWIAEWVDALERTTDPPWVRVPEGEDPRPLWQHLRLQATLRGRTLQGLDLADELADIDHGVALDQWSAHAVALDVEWLAVLATDVDAWKRRALESLERAVALERSRRPGAPRLFVVSGDAPGSGAFRLQPVPPVAEEAVARFFERALAGEDPSRRAAFAARLASAAGGSASRLDHALRAAQARGWILAQDRGHRLRPGALPDPPLLAVTEARATELALLARPELLVLQALQVCGGRAPSAEIETLAELEPRAFGAAFLRLRHDGWIESDEASGDMRLVRSVDRPVLGADELRAAHGRRARALDRLDQGGGAGHRSRAALHRVFARPLDGAAPELVAALAALREQGRGEAMLERIDRARDAARIFGLELVDVDPALCIESARSWCSIGQTENALRSIEPLIASSEPRHRAWVELVRAEVARLRHETDATFAHYDRAAALDPTARLEALTGRVHLLHSLGKDEETCRAYAELDPLALEAAGVLEPRKRAYLESALAMSLHRLGRVDEARAILERLIRQVERDGGVDLEAAERINLAILERGSGSLRTARAELERAVALYDRAGLVAGLAHARGTLGGLLRELGELVEAEPLLVSAMEIRQRLSDPEGSALARGMLGLLQFERGHARAAIETLESTADSMGGAQRRRFAPLLQMKAAEMRARIGDFTRVDAVPLDQEGLDPRVLVARARIDWLRGEPRSAAELAGRAAALSRALRLERLAREADVLAARIEGRLLPRPASSETLSDFDEELLELLRPERYDEARMEALAGELARRGRDDRAARLWLALSARAASAERALAFGERSRAALETCTTGLSQAEQAVYRRHLLGEPDPFPGDFAPRSDTLDRPEDLEMDIVALLEINRQLVLQQDLDALLGLIVEHALGVTGAERGFLVLEEHGELRFDRALDSARGDIAHPEFEVSGSVVREALQHMQALRVSNAVDDPLLGHRTSVVSLELRSILCVPFEISRDLRGAIYVDHRLRRGAFDARAERLCHLLADQAALAILQVKRMEEIRALNRELERRVVEKEVDLRNARRALHAAGAPDPGMLIGRSLAIGKVQELIARAAPSDLAVLVQGESGTGKELVARSLHEQSLRRRAAFVSESCAALPAALIESELFGYRKGAFTGADRHRAGLFEQAAGGTLFLDEIAELPLDLQAKFLRVLETGEMRRLGEDTPHRVDFRLIVATNRDLEREVRENRFRQDLFYRVAGLAIHVPTLAERTEDIELLVEHFLRLEEAAGKPRRRVSKRLLSTLARRPWPGNVRELRNEIARLCVLCEGDLDDASLVSRPATFEVETGVKEILPLSELERRAIHAALEKTGGDKRRAAELLGISRAKIYQRLKEWNVPSARGPGTSDEP